MIDHAPYLAACERLRQVSEGHEPRDVYGCDSENEVNADKLTVYDAEHDETPATAEWCREIGFAPQAGNDFLSIGCVHMVRRFSDRGLSLVVEDIDGEQVVASKRPTRGDVLRLLGTFQPKA